MKLQIQAQEMRFRITETELATLLATGELVDQSRLPDDSLWRRRVYLTTLAEAALSCESATWSLSLPREQVAALAARIPSSDGLHYALASVAGSMMAVSFDVDLRSSSRFEAAPRSQR
jgi:hypothetical protein